MKRVWWIYLYYIESHDNFGKWFDPFSARRINALPPYDENRAAIYRKYAGTSMMWWRSFFGFGSMIFQFAVFTALDALDWFVVLRGIGMNLFYIGYLRPLQRKASKKAFEAMGIDPSALSRP
jgi:hypothetical protein